MIVAKMAIEYSLVQPDQLVGSADAETVSLRDIQIWALSTPYSL